MSEKALAFQLYGTVHGEASGSIFTEPLSVWVEGLCSFPNKPGPPNLITGAGNLVSVRNFAKSNKLLGTSTKKSGIIELVVIPEQQFVLYPSSSHQVIPDTAVLQRVRMRCKVRRFRQPGARSATVDRRFPHGSGKEDRSLTASRSAAPRSGTSGQNAPGD